MRRVRATFLLRCVSLAASVSLVLAVFALGQSMGWTLGSIAVVVLGWFVGIEAGVVPTILERAAVARATRRGGRVNSLWFVDVDRQRQERRNRFYEDTQDNPTIR